MDNNSKKVICTTISIACIVLAVVFFSKGFSKYDKPNSWPNRHVNGDAYNYLINGTHFAGFMVLGVGSSICASIFAAVAFIIPKDKWDVPRDEYQWMSQQHGSWGEQRAYERDRQNLPPLAPLAPLSQAARTVQMEHAEPEEPQSETIWKCPDCDKKYRKQIKCPNCGCKKNLMVPISRTKKDPEQGEV